MNTTLLLNISCNLLEELKSVECMLVELNKFDLEGQCASLQKELNNSLDGLDSLEFEKKLTALTAEYNSFKESHAITTQYMESLSRQYKDAFHSVSKESDLLRTVLSMKGRINRIGGEIDKIKKQILNTCSST